MEETVELSQEFDERLSKGEDSSSGRAGPISKTADRTEMRQAQFLPPIPAKESTTPPSRSNDTMMTTTISPSSTTPALPPHMIPYATQPSSTILSTISQTPLFMTSLTPNDEPNPDLEALQALAYEGPPWEAAHNFRSQGNECFRARRWGDAREFYGKALGVLEEARKNGGSEEEGEERRKEREIEEICLVNRAACNLELKNYRQTTLDTTRALTLNPSNLKAHYRLSLAHYHLNHLPTALRTTLHALTLSPANPSLLSLQQKIQTAQSHLASQEEARLARAAALRAAHAKLQDALKNRNIITRATATKPLLPDPDARIVLGEEDSMLYFPTLVLYPLTLQSDFISKLGEDELLGQRLVEMLPPPWDEAREYTPGGVECYMETAAGGLVKIGKKVPIRTVLGSGKVEVVDGVVRILVVPREKSSKWIEEFKAAKR